jgi:hypothetical protein
MTDTADEDKEIERIARIAMMNSLLARARHAEAERERMMVERDAAIMDADMQAREAGNMEHNARVLMAERDRLRDAVRAFLDADEHWKRSPGNREWYAMMAAAGDKARAALKENDQ